MGSVLVYRDFPYLYGIIRIPPDCRRRFGGVARVVRKKNHRAEARREEGFTGREGWGTLRRPFAATLRLLKLSPVKAK